MPGVFVSHASADKEFVDAFVERILRLGCGLPPDLIFYTSGADTGVPSGADLSSYIRDRVSNVGLIVAIITPTFQTRPYCIAELGAAWGQVGVLFPLLAPGMSRSDLDGVLSSLAVRYADDSTVLDELHDAVTRVTKIRVLATTWNTQKERWLASVETLASRIPASKTISNAQYDQLKGQLETTRVALVESEDDLRKTRDALDKLAQAKTVEEVRQVLLPDNEIERFWVLRNSLVEETKQVPSVVVDVIWHKISHRTFRWPTWQEEQDLYNETLQAVDDGFLIDDDETPLDINNEFPSVKRCYEAAQSLAGFLAEEASHEFDEWFRNNFDLPPDLTAKRVWTTLLSSRIEPL